MSSYHFISKINITDAEPLALFCNTLNEYENASSKEVKNALVVNLHTTIDGSEFIGGKDIAQLSVTVVDGVCRMYSDTPEMDFDFFDDLITLIENLGAQDYHARLLDTSSGGVHSWGGPEDEIDFDGKRVSVLGIDEEEGIHEALENCDAIVSRVFNMNVEIIVHSENFDMSEYKEYLSSDIILIEEEYFWDYLEADCE